MLFSTQLVEKMSREELKAMIYETRQKQRQAEVLQSTALPACVYAFLCARVCVLGFLPSISAVEKVMLHILISLTFECSTT
jgi:hypothetical protein